jgi:PAS domain S-box-containing protein
MDIDIRTLSLLIGISFIMQSIALYVVYLQSKPYKGLLAWTIGSSVMALGFLFMLARQIPDFERLSIVIANCLQVGGMVLIYIGTIRSTGKKEKGKLITSLLVIYTLIVVYFTYIDNQLNLRTILFSLSLAFVSFMISITLFKQKIPSIKQSSLFVSTVFFLLALFFIIRTIVLFSSPLLDFFNQSSLQTYTFLATFCFGILWTFGLIILVNQKFYTDRVEAERHLGEKEVQYRNLANSGLALIWTAATDKLCTYFNNPWLKFTGRTIDQELGIGWLEGVHPDDVEHCLQTYTSAFEKRDPFYMEYRLKHHTGEYRWIQDMGTPNYNSDGMFIGYIGHCFDITDRKKMEFDLIAAKEKAEESDRLKSSFLANLSHEIRTPMNSIMGFASLLPDEQDKELIDKYAQTIVRSSEQLTHIIDDIVLYSKLQTKLLSYFPAQFEVNKLLADVRQSFNLPDYQRGVELLIDQNSNEAISLVSDYEKVRQIITNLVSNAFKYTPRGTITLGYQQTDENIILFVKDTGMGIPSNELQRIFERFYRGSNVNKGVISGTGLGLSIVEELIEILNGKIWVESETGKGSCFYIALPNKPDRKA